MVFRNEVCSKDQLVSCRFVGEVCDGFDVTTLRCFEDRSSTWNLIVEDIEITETILYEVI